MPPRGDGPQGELTLLGMRGYVGGDKSGSVAVTIFLDPGGWFAGAPAVPRPPPSVPSSWFPDSLEASHRQVAWPNYVFNLLIPWAADLLGSDELVVNA